MLSGCSWVRPLSEACRQTNRNGGDLCLHSEKPKGGLTQTWSWDAGCSYRFQSLEDGLTGTGLRVSLWVLMLSAVSDTTYKRGAQMQSKAENSRRDERWVPIGFAERRRAWGSEVTVLP